MDWTQAAEGWIPANYLHLGEQAIKTRSGLIKTVLSQRRLPEDGWDDELVKLFLHEIAMMDSNNFPGNAGVGEREGRVLSSIVRSRHFGLAHGIGRSGDISAVQPKAAGSSLLNKLCNALVKDAFESAGMKEVGEVLTVPVATGMALTLVLLALKQRKPSATKVIWPRIDQKTCVKCVIGAGLELVTVEMELVDDQLQTDVDAVAEEIARHGSDVLCVLTTTSCFAPRAMDDVVSVAKLCKKHDVGHVINNAYGVQCAMISEHITAAWRKGRVDAVVQSTDKNFMVPVGGAVLTARKGCGDVVALVGKNYPGRASISPLLDVIITLLSLGRKGWLNLLEERERMFAYLRERLEEFARTQNEVVLETPGNPISLAMTLDALHESHGGVGGDENDVRALGSMLFHRRISGARVYSPGKPQNVAGLSFANYGAHSDGYPHHYINAAAAIGMRREDVDLLIQRMQSCFEHIAKKGGA